MKTTQNDLSRRDLLIGAGTLGAALASGTAFAGDHAHHDHAQHAPRHDDLLDATNDCLDKGQRCIAHCMVAFREGDTSLAVCAGKVQEMQAICDAYSFLLTANSGYNKDFAGICKTACQDCATECEKHADEHQECKKCMDACKDVVAAIGKTFG